MHKKLEKHHEKKKHGGKEHAKHEHAHKAKMASAYHKPKKAHSRGK